MMRCAKPMAHRWRTEEKEDAPCAVRHPKGVAHRHTEAPGRWRTGDAP